MATYYIIYQGKKCNQVLGHRFGKNKVCMLLSNVSFWACLLDETYKRMLCLCDINTINIIVLDLFIHCRRFTFILPVPI